MKLCWMCNDTKPDYLGCEECDGEFVVELGRLTDLAAKLYEHELIFSDLTLTPMLENFFDEIKEDQYDLDTFLDDNEEDEE